MRPVTPDDADELAKLDAVLFPENCLNEKTLAAEVALGFGWVIERNRQVIAYALVRDDGAVLDLIRLGVHPNHQGKGLGVLLLSKLLQHKRPTMLTVRDKNQGALRLYHRAGFDIVGRLQDNDDSGWVMLANATSAAC